MAVVGLGGAVATTAVAGIELIRRGLAGTEGLPLAGIEVEGMVPYENLVFGGWDLSGDDLASAAMSHGVLEPAQIEAVKPTLVSQRPWPAVGSEEFCRNASGDNVLAVTGHRAAVEAIRSDLRRFREENDLDGVVVVNLASVERAVDLSLPQLATPEAFEAAVRDDDPAVGPAMLYAYAAILEGAPYANFTPSVGADVPALVALAEERGVPVSGKDGKTGQTMMKTVLAPAFAMRQLKVEGWYSTNILGNGDGRVLDDPNSLASKIDTKGSVLDDMLGYEVGNHVVRIDYYPPRGDRKEAWDNIDLTGFLGARMQVKVDFLCSDSALAAPLAIELARLSDLAQRRGQGGVQEQFGSFFKAPMTKAPGARPEHALHRQQERLLAWISGGGAANNGANGSLPPVNAEASQARDS
jgi:myo-inositol-1-phosphate synthase